jgi:hypothetical protein
MSTFQWCHPQAVSQRSLCLTRYKCIPCPGLFFTLQRDTLARIYPVDGPHRIQLLQDAHHITTDSAGGSPTPVTAPLQPTQGVDEVG